MQRHPQRHRMVLMASELLWRPLNALPLLGGSVPPCHRGECPRWQRVHGAASYGTLRLLLTPVRGNTPVID